MTEGGNKEAGGKTSLHVSKEQLEEDFVQLEFSPLSPKEVGPLLDDLFGDLDSPRPMDSILAQVELCKLVLDRADNKLRPATAEAMRKKISKGVVQERWELFLDRLAKRLDEAGQSEGIGVNGALVRRDSPVEDIRVIGELVKLRDFGRVFERITQRLGQIANDSHISEHAAAAREVLKSIRTASLESAGRPKNEKHPKPPVVRKGIVGKPPRIAYATG